MVGIDECPDGIVPKVIAGGLLRSVSQEDAGYGKELQEVEVWDAFFTGCTHGGNAEICAKIGSLFEIWKFVEVFLRGIIE